ncbi:MAG: hypothetical protein GY862_22145 [Gammaproteobacteria bacterium]|nr:hypothetical protein [Gammaproteobacteria bacterium]
MERALKAASALAGAVFLCLAFLLFLPFLLFFRGLAVIGGRFGGLRWHRRGELNKQAAFKQSKKLVFLLIYLAPVQLRLQSFGMPGRSLKRWALGRYGPEKK